MDSVARLALQEFWDIRAHSIHCTAGEEGRQCFEATTDRRRVFAKVQETEGEFFDDIIRGVLVQTYVRKQGLATNDVIPTSSGSLYATLHGYGIVVEPWLDRKLCEGSVVQWEEFGRIVGQLHSMPIPEELQDCLSKMEPRRKLEHIRSRVLEFRGRVPREQESLLSSFCESAKELDEFPAAPRALVHSDLAWSNVVLTTEGSLLLVDFEGAGVGPPVIDLVEVTTYLCRGPSASGPLLEEAAQAFYSGYAMHRKVSAAEIRLFPAAHFYHQLYYLENSLSRGDFDFLHRMSNRLNSWNGGTLRQLVAIVEAQARA